MHPHKPEHMRSTRLRSERTADIAGLGVFPEAFDWVSDFFVSRLEDLSTLIPFASNFGAGRGFFAFLKSCSSSESSWLLPSVSVFLRFLDFVPCPGSARALRFFGGGGVGV